MRGSERGRITFRDLIILGATLVACGPLIVAFLRLLDQNAGLLGVGTGYLLQLFVPAFLLTILYIIWRLATLGVPR